MNTLWSHCDFILLTIFNYVFKRIDSIIWINSLNVFISKLSTKIWALSSPFYLNAEGHLLITSVTICPMSWGDKCLSFS